jgi:hypothetical protein
MTKEKFLKYMRLIQNYDSECQTLTVLINKISSGFSVACFGSYLVSAIVEMINDTMEIMDKSLLEWWLYEDIEKVVYYYNNEKCEQIPIRIETLEELYDYLIGKNHIPEVGKMACPECGNVLEHGGGCVLCHDCGYTGCES